MFAAINFSIRTPGFGNVPTLLLHYVRHIKPALQVSATKFSLCVLFVTRALEVLFDFDFVMRKLLGFYFLCPWSGQIILSNSAGSTFFLILPEPALLH